MIAEISSSDKFLLSQFNILNFPFVRVPVLSKIIFTIDFIFSKILESFIIKPFLTADLRDIPNVSGSMKTNAHGQAMRTKETVLFRASEVPYKFDIVKNPISDTMATKEVKTAAYLSLNPSKLIFCS